MAKRFLLNIEGKSVQLYKYKKEDYFSLTDMVKGFEGKDQIIRNWIRTKSTIEFLEIWEKLHNTDFDIIQSQELRNQAGGNTFTLSPQRWIKMTNAIGIISKSGRYGGTYAHEDIALEFGSYLSASFKLHLIQEFKRFKKEEAKQLEWDVRRLLSKVNYKIHTDAVKQNLIPERIIDTKTVGLYYASEADILNVAVFGITAKGWREHNPNKKGNLRDHATAEQLLILANLESLNAEYIKEGLNQSERIKRLNEIAIYQMTLLVNDENLKKLF